MPASVSIGQRFAQLIQHLGLSKNAFAQSLNKTATVVQHLVDERNKPGYDLLCKVFEVYPNVSKDWLLLGQGPMLLSGTSAGNSNARAPAAKAVGRRPTPLDFSNADFSNPAPAALSPAPEAIVPPPPQDALPEVPAAPAPQPPAPSDIPVPTPSSVANAAAPDTYVTAALHAQYLQHQLALAEQRNQHLLEQQRLMQQLLELALHQRAA